MEDEAFLGNEIISLIERAPSSRAPYGPFEHPAIPQLLLIAKTGEGKKKKREGERKKRKRRGVLQTKKISGEKSSSSLISSGNECKDCWPFCGEHGETGLTHIASPRFPYLSRRATPPSRFSSRYRLDSAFNSSFFLSRFLGQEKFLNAICENWNIIALYTIEWNFDSMLGGSIEFFIFFFFVLNFVPDNQREDT